MSTTSKLWSPSFVLACGANFSMFFAFYMLLPILPIYLAEDLMASSSQVGLVLSCYVIMALCIRPFAGFFVDSLPRKKLLLVCFAIYSACFGAYLVASTLLIFAIFRAFHGASFGITTVSLNTLAIDIMPSERRGEGVGYFGVTSNLAMAIGPMVALMVYEKYASFDLLFMIAIGMCIVGLFLASFIKAKERPRVHDKEPLSLDRFILIKGLPAALAMALISVSYGILNTYIAIYGQQAVGIESGAGMFFVYFAGGLIVSRLVAGKSINRGLFRPVTITGISILISSYTLFIIFQIPIVYYSSAVAMGVGYGMLSPAFQTMLINLAPHNKRGTANATYLASWDLGIGLGVLMGGVIADYWTLTNAFMVGVGMLIIGLIHYVFVVSAHYQANKLR